jgi:spore coat protein H
MLAVAAQLACLSCGGEPVDGTDGGPSTGGSDEEADYRALFTDGQVVRLDVQIAIGDWERMLADMTELAGTFGSRKGQGTGFGGGAPGAGGGAFPGVDGGVSEDLTGACRARAEGDSCGTSDAAAPSGRCTRVPFSQGLVCLDGGGGMGGPGRPGDGGAGVDPGGMGDGEILARTPIYVACRLTVASRTYENVGIRFKGNSSLQSSWSAGIYKLPFRLDADELQNVHPEVANQRIHGFKALSLSSGFSDASLSRDKVTADIFRAASVPAPRTSFAILYVDHGAGPQYFGLYSMAEVPAKPLLRAQFGDDTGNLYKPQGTGAHFTVFDQTSFEKKTNKGAADYSDVQRAISALNSSRSDSAAWRSRLETTFDVPVFLRWLAINTVVGNWDSYGQMAHNYFLYGNPANGGRLTWISWDHDLSFQAGFGGASTGSGDVMHDSTDQSWPLIRYLLDDPTYRAVYVAELKSAIAGVASLASVRSRFETAQRLIRPYAVGGSGQIGEQPGYTFLSSAQAFETALEGSGGVLTYLEGRVAEVAALP